MYTNTHRQEECKALCYWRNASPSPYLLTHFSTNLKTSVHAVARYQHAKRQYVFRNDWNRSLHCLVWQHSVADLKLFGRMSCHLEVSLARQITTCCKGVVIPLINETVSSFICIGQKGQKETFTRNSCLRRQFLQKWNEPNTNVNKQKTCLFYSYKTDKAQQRAQTRLHAHAHTHTHKNDHRSKYNHISQNRRRKGICICIYDWGNESSLE